MALLPEGATALEIPSDHPAFVDSFAGFGVRPPATAVRLVIPPSERRRERPERQYVTIRLSPEGALYAKRFAYAYITPARADPGPGAVRVVFELEHPREIPHELRIGYSDGSTSVVPVEIVTVWDNSESYDANEEYVRLFHAPAAAA